jgi:hypothetical protein
MSESASASASSEPRRAVERAFLLPADAAAPTFLDGVLQSIATPGAGPGLVAAVNGSLLLMVAATAWIAWRLDDAFARRELLPLLGVGAALALGLLAAFNAFIAFGGGGGAAAAVEAAAGAEAPAASGATTAAGAVVAAAAAAAPAAPAEAGATPTDATAAGARRRAGGGASRELG